MEFKRITRSSKITLINLLDLNKKIKTNNKYKKINLTRKEKLSLNKMKKYIINFNLYKNKEKRIIILKEIIKSVIYDDSFYWMIQNKKFRNCIIDKLQHGISHDSKFNMFIKDFYNLLLLSL